MLLSVCFAAAPLTSCGDDSEKEIKELTKKIEALEEKCGQLESDLSDAESEIKDLTGKVDDQQASIDKLEDKLDEISDTVEELDKSSGEKSNGGNNNNKNNNNNEEHTGNGGTDPDPEDNPKIHPLTLGGSELVSGEMLSVDDEEITPKSDKIPDEYKPKQTSDYVVWLNVSEDKDFVFNGETVLLTIKVKEDAPDGVYPIVLEPDLSDIEGHEPDFDEVINGSICINSKAEPFNGGSTDGFVFYGDSVSCKPGDTVKFNISIANNPGLAAFFIRMYFDSNAIEILDAEATGEFKNINNKW